MRFHIITAVFGLSVCLSAGQVASGQAGQGDLEVSLFALAYKAVDSVSGLPRGDRVVTHDDPMLGTSAARREEVKAANARFAMVTGRPTAALKDVLICDTAKGCEFKGGIVATASFRMESQWPDSAVVLVATRHFPPTRPSYGPRWQLMSMYGVRLARRSGEWKVVSMSPRVES